MRGFFLIYFKFRGGLGRWDQVVKFGEVVWEGFVGEGLRCFSTVRGDESLSTVFLQIL